MLIASYEHLHLRALIPHHLLFLALYPSILTSPPLIYHAHCRHADPALFIDKRLDYNFRLAIEQPSIRLRCNPLFHSS